MKTFREYVTEQDEFQITKGNWEFLKKFMEKQPGFLSWEFERKYDELVIKFKTNMQAIKAQAKSNKSTTEISAFGQSSAGDSEIRVELNDDAKNGLTLS